MAKTIQEDSVQRRVHLRSHQGKTIIIENNTRRFRNVEQFTRSVHKVVAWFILTKTKILIEEIDAQKTGLGLIGPGNGRFTRLVEILLKTKKGPGYTYVFRDCIFKVSPLLGHLTGLLTCNLFGKNIGRMIVNKI